MMMNQGDNLLNINDKSMNLITAVTRFGRNELCVELQSYINVAFRTNMHSYINTDINS